MDTTEIPIMCSADEMYGITTDMILKHKGMLADTLQDTKYGILDKLLANDGLTYRETTAIECLANPCERSSQLIDVVLRKNSLSHFIKALVDTNQKHLVNYLRGNGVHSAEFGDDWPLENECIKQLNMNQDHLIDIIDPCSGLISILFSAAVINKRQFSFISDDNNSVDKSKALLNIIRRQSVKDYNGTIRCLIVSSQPHVAEILQGKGVIQRIRVCQEGDPQTVNETEDLIVRRIADMVRDRPIEEAQRLLGMAELKIIHAKKGKSIYLYVYCATLEELMALHDLLFTGAMKTIVETLFTKMASRQDPIFVSNTYSEEEYIRCKSYFEDPNGSHRMTMMSGLGTLDGVGGSGGIIATVSCSKCNTENEIKLGEVQYTSIYKLVTCRSCDGEIVLNDDLMDSGITSVVTMESAAYGGTIGRGYKSTDEEPEEGAHPRSVGLQQSSLNRELKSGASVTTEVGSGLNRPTETIQQSASLDAIAQNRSELKQLSAMIKEHSCPYCGCADSDVMCRIEGMKNVIYCLCCESVYGIDDGMSSSDLQELLSTGFRMEPCSSCGNDDPDMFTLERSSAGEIDSSTDLVVRCNVCSTVSLSGLDGQVVVEPNSGAAVEVSGTTECSLCGNKDSQKFQVQLDEHNNTIESVCMVCNNKKLTKASGQVCSCEEASIIYGFNEYGYVSQIKCNACGAITEMSDDARKKAASDGSSCGRTRIQSLDLVKRGDHIAWHQWLGYWHHAIVVEVQFNWINVIHYNGPSAYKGEIVDEWRELDATREEVYRINYDRKVTTYDPDIIVERARSRLGEHSYNLLTNNCEHFARWCVTSEVQTFYEAILSSMKVAAKGRAAQSLVKKGLNLARKDNLKVPVAVGDRGVSALVRSDEKAVAGIVTTVATGEVKSVASGSFAKGLTAGFLVGYEIYSVVTDIHHAHRQRADGAIDRNLFLKVTIKRSCEWVGSAVTLTIPVAYNSVGLTLGTIIEKGIGSIVGRNAAIG